MNKQKTDKSTTVPAEVRKFLAKNGKLGGEATKRLIDAGKKALGEDEETTQSRSRKH